MNDSQMGGAQMGGGDEISELTRLLPPPAAPEMTARRSQALRAHLMAEVARERHGAAPVGAPPRRRRLAARPWVPALAGVVAVAAAAAVAVTVLTPGAPGGGSPVAGNSGPAAGGGMTAITLLAKVADAAAQQHEPKVSDSEFVYVRSAVSWGTPLHERQVWVSVASLCAPPGLLIEHGKRISLGNQDASSQPTVPGYCGGGVNDPTYRFLQRLPTDPRTLLNFIYHQIRGERWGSELAREEFTTIGDMIRESIVPPKTAAGLFRAAALIPGVRLVGHVTNAVGRPGIAVSFKGHGDLVASEWIFDPVTYQFIGEREGGNSQTAILQQGFVAHAGQRP